MEVSMEQAVQIIGAKQIQIEFLLLEIAQLKARLVAADEALEHATIEAQAEAPTAEGKD